MIVPLIKPSASYHQLLTTGALEDHIHRNSTLPIQSIHPSPTDYSRQDVHWQVTRHPHQVPVDDMCTYVCGQPFYRVYRNKLTYFETDRVHRSAPVLSFILICTICRWKHQPAGKAEHHVDHVATMPPCATADYTMSVRFTSGNTFARSAAST